MREPTRDLLGGGWINRGDKVRELVDGVVGLKMLTGVRVNDIVLLIDDRRVRRPVSG